MHNGVEAKNPYGARLGTKQSEQVFDESRFARAVYTYQPVNLTFLRMEVDLVEDSLLPNVRDRL